MLKISACSENCSTCWKSVFKISAHVENYNTCSKLCWIFQGVLKTCWKFQDMLKTVIYVENYVETTCWKFQLVLKTVTHVESYVKISRYVENVYVSMLKTILKTVLWYEEKHHHTLRHVLKLSGRFCFSSSILHTFAMWDICILQHSGYSIFSFLTFSSTPKIDENGKFEHSNIIDTKFKWHQPQMAHSACTTWLHYVGNLLSEKSPYPWQNPKSAP